MKRSFPDDWLYDNNDILQLLGTAGTVEKHEKFNHLKLIIAESKMSTLKLTYASKCQACSQGRFEGVRSNLPLPSKRF